MHFNHYGGEAALLAADLVNSLAGDAPLAPLLAARGVTEHALSAAEEAELRGWAARLAECFGPQDLPYRCARVNALLAQASSSPRITLHDGHPHFHYSAPAADPAAHVRALTAAGLAYVVCFAEAHRLGRCARASCGTAFVDTSRNGRRAYCSVRCANNDAVARHRDRRRR
ncbi:CGNR zinc finger domain-containing protein [Streptomyces sp. NPDC087300]|uniref:CGNR zinc finger domain-containing protein n=1 Tax=Streptomyces sp. NPDC087300 TaxID=3365780 RepID=UPI00382D4779